MTTITRRILLVPGEFRATALSFLACILGYAADVGQLKQLGDLRPELPVADHVRALADSLTLSRQLGHKREAPRRPRLAQAGGNAESSARMAARLPCGGA